MNLDKAIEILNLDLTYSYPAHFDDLQYAHRLAIEALKLIKAHRANPIGINFKLLPGESPSDNSTRSLHHIKDLLENPLGREPTRLSECPFEHLRDYPDCYEDCPDVEACPHPKKVRL